MMVVANSIQWLKCMHVPRSLVCWWSSKRWRCSKLALCSHVTYVMTRVMFFHVFPLFTTGRLELEGPIIPKSIWSSSNLHAARKLRSSPGEHSWTLPAGAASCVFFPQLWFLWGVEPKNLKDFNPKPGPKHPLNRSKLNSPLSPPVAQNLEDPQRHPQTRN